MLSAGNLKSASCEQQRWQSFYKYMEQTVQQPCHSMYSLSHVTDRERESLDRAVDDEIKSDSYMF